MDTLDIAVLGATILLFALGVRALLTKTEPGDPPPMGCGYGIVAGALLAYQFREEAGGILNGLRLGLGVALILPGLKALLRPQGRSLPVAVVAFLIALLVAAEPAEQLYNRVRGIEAPITMEERLERMESATGNLEDLHDILSTKEQGLKAEIRELGGNKEEVLAHPEAETKLAQLQAVLARKARIEEQQVLLEQGIEELRIEIEQLELAGKVGGFDHLDPKFREVLQEIEDTTIDTEGGAIEQAMKRAELEELYDDEF